MSEKTTIEVTAGKFELAELLPPKVRTAGIYARHRGCKKAILVTDKPERYSEAGGHDGAWKLVCPDCGHVGLAESATKKASKPKAEPKAEPKGTSK